MLARNKIAKIIKATKNYKISIFISNFFVINLSFWRYVFEIFQIKHISASGLIFNFQYIITDFYFLFIVGLINLKEKKQQKKVILCKNCIIISLLALEHQHKDLIFYLFEIKVNVF